MPREYETRLRTARQQFSVHILISWVTKVISDATESDMNRAK